MPWSVYALERVECGGRGSVRAELDERQQADEAQSDELRADWCCEPLCGVRLRHGVVWGSAMDMSDMSAFAEVS
jgi:hypothetical protein